MGTYIFWQETTLSRSISGCYATMNLMRVIEFVIFVFRPCWVFDGSKSRGVGIGWGIVGN
jgi:hypothetical protein